MFIYNKITYIRRKYGVEIKPLALFERLMVISENKKGKRRPVLTSMDNSWEVHSLDWVEFKDTKQPDFRKTVGSRPAQDRFQNGTTTKDYSEDTAFNQIRDEYPDF